MNNHIRHTRRVIENGRLPSMGTPVFLRGSNTTCEKLKFKVTYGEDNLVWLEGTIWTQLLWDYDVLFSELVDTYGQPGVLYMWEWEAIETRSKPPKEMIYSTMNI